MILVVDAKAAESAEDYNARAALRQEISAS